MKNKVVVWGTNAQNEKVLIALELQTDTNKVLLHTFPEAIAGEEFVNKMMNDWREGRPVEFPEGHTTLERELGVTESLLTEDLKADKPEIVQRAQTEWHFVVLSAKLHHAYEQELAEFKEKIENLERYDSKVFNNLRTFWQKVNNQMRDGNLLKRQGNKLRDSINALFDDLKKVRDRADSEFLEVSQKVHDEFSAALDVVEKRIASGSFKMQAVFEDLKNLQSRYRNARLGNEHRESIWKRLDGAFKAAKEGRFGPGVNEGSLVDRHSRRLEGLREAIKRMEDNVRRDDEELKFQRKKVAASEGQLEAQIRQAKIKMVEDRLNGKRERLDDMLKTLADVERQVASAQEKEARRAEKDAERRKMAEAREAAKAEIAAGIKAKGRRGQGAEAGAATALTNAPADEASEASENPAAESLAGPAEAPAEAPAAEARDTFFADLGDTLTAAFEDVVDTVKAVASVAGDRAAEALDTATEKARPMLDAAADKAGDLFASAKETAEEVYEKVSEKAGPALESARATAAGLYEQAAEKVGDAYHAAAEKAGDLVDSFRKDEDAAVPATEDLPTNEVAPEAPTEPTPDPETAALTEAAEGDPTAAEPNPEKPADDAATDKGGADETAPAPSRKKAASTDDATQQDSPVELSDDVVTNRTGLEGEDDNIFEK